MNLVMTQRPAHVPMVNACAALRLNRSSVYGRSQRGGLATPSRSAREHAVQPRALSPEEREQVREVLHSEAFRDQPPAQVYQQLLEQDQYLCSVSTMHRILRAGGENGERRDQRPAQHHAIPRLCAEAPNEVWTWDISKLATTTRGVYLSLYVVLDLFSRFVVAWMVSAKENSALAQQLMGEAITRYAIPVGQLTLHQDRGSPMIAHRFLDLLGEMGVTPSHSRPRVSNDNPFSEAQFKTQKSQPDYPGRFLGLEHARAWCTDYFEWYNSTHHHCGLAGFTPEQVFTGRYRAIAAQKQAALDAGYKAKPERFVKGRPSVPMPPTVVTINPLTSEQIDAGESTAVNFPTLSAARRKSELISK